MTTVETIDFLRKSKSMTRYELCKKADISQSTISSWNKRSEPTLKALEKVCGAFNITLSEFFLLRDELSQSPSLFQMAGAYCALAEKHKRFILKIIDFLKLE